jgi:hypothetical protein
MERFLLSAAPWPLHRRVGSGHCVYATLFRLDFVKHKTRWNRKKKLRKRNVRGRPVALTANFEQEIFDMKKKTENSIYFCVYFRLHSTKTWPTGRDAFPISYQFSTFFYEEEKRFDLYLISFADDNYAGLADWNLMGNR